MVGEIKHTFSNDNGIRQRNFTIENNMKTIMIHETRIK